MEPFQLAWVQYFDRKLSLSKANKIMMTGTIPDDTICTIKSEGVFMEPQTHFPLHTIIHMKDLQCRAVFTGFKQHAHIKMDIQGFGESNRCRRLPSRLSVHGDAVLYDNEVLQEISDHLVIRGILAIYGSVREGSQQRFELLRQRGQIGHILYT